MSSTTLADLDYLPLWVPWQAEPAEKPDAEPRKVPWRARGRVSHASAIEPSHWGTRNEAETRAARLEKPLGLGGIGLVLTKIGEGLCLAGIDLDTCRDPESGQFAEWAAAVIQRFASYAEISPSDTGAKVFFLLQEEYREELLARMREPGSEAVGTKWVGGEGQHPPAIELYLGRRFFTVTGRSLGEPDGLRVVEADTLLWLIAEAGPALAARGARANGASERKDFSRSGDAAALARRAYRGGMTYQEYVAALHENPQTAQWARVKGAAHGDREIKRAWTLVSNDANNDAVSLNDFWAYLPQHNYIFSPTRQHWPAASVNAQVPPVPMLKRDGSPVVDKDGKPKYVPAATWLDGNRAVVQMTWEPGSPLIIRDRLMLDSGWISQEGVCVFNLYVPPTSQPGDAAHAARWTELVQYVYPEDADHIFDWLAHRVQRPAEKLNHALVLGGDPGVGKDTILEGVADAIGRWNLQDTSPDEMMTQAQNPYAKAVVLRINEARDLGESDRFKFYDHTKRLIAAPPPVLTINEKYVRQYLIPNVCGVVITTNHKTDGIYLPAEDRRHYVAWSERKKEDEFYKNDYWRKLWKWMAQEGGSGHIAAWLRERNICGFDPKAPPPQTAAFWAIANANRPAEEGELADALDAMGNPSTLTTEELLVYVPQYGDFGLWLADRRNRRVIPHRLETCGYVPVRNPDANDGLWKCGGRRQVIYARKDLSSGGQIDAARKYSRAERSSREAALQGYPV